MTQISTRIKFLFGVVMGALVIMLLISFLVLREPRNREPKRYEDRLRIEKVDVNTYIVTDRDTGIEYLVVAGSGVSVLYDTDGSIRIANGWRDSDGV